MSKSEEKVVVKSVEKSESQVIWDEIKGTMLNFYGMAGKSAEEHFTPIAGATESLYLKQISKAPLASATLADLLADKFTVDLSGAYVVITRN